MSEEAIEVVGGAIFDERGRCLIARRSAEMAHPLLWEFPGGKVERGEDPREALVRELAEELGVEVEVGEFVARGEGVSGGGRRIVLDVWRARIVSGEPVLTEHVEARWVDPRDFEQYDWPPADIAAVEALRAQSTKRAR